MHSAELALNFPSKCPVCGVCGWREIREEDFASHTFRGCSKAKQFTDDSPEAEPLSALQLPLSPSIHSGPSYLLGGATHGQSKSLPVVTDMLTVTLY